MTGDVFRTRQEIEAQLEAARDTFTWSGNPELLEIRSRVVIETLEWILGKREKPPMS